MSVHHLGRGVGHMSRRSQQVGGEPEPVELQLNPDPDLTDGPGWTITGGAWVIEGGIATGQGEQGSFRRTATAPGVEGATVRYLINMPANPNNSLTRFFAFGTLLFETTDSGVFENDVILGPVTTTFVNCADQDGNGGQEITTFSVVGSAPPFDP